MYVLKKIFALIIFSECNDDRKEFNFVSLIFPAPKNLICKIINNNIKIKKCLKNFMNFNSFISTKIKVIRFKANNF